MNAENEIKVIINEKKFKIKIIFKINLLENNLIMFRKNFANYFFAVLQ